MFFVKAGLAALSATLIWHTASALGAEPRPLDWFILFSIDYTGVGVVLRKRGYDA